MNIYDWNINVNLLFSLEMVTRKFYLNCICSYVHVEKDFLRGLSSSWGGRFWCNIYLLRVASFLSLFGALGVELEDMHTGACPLFRTQRRVRVGYKLPLWPTLRWAGRRASSCCPALTDADPHGSSLASPLSVPNWQLHCCPVWVLGKRVKV